MIDTKRTFGELLKSRGLITDEQLQKGLQAQKDQGGVLGRILVDLGYVTSKDIAKILGEQYGMDVIDLDNMDIAPDVIDMVSVTMAQTYHVIPVSFDDNVLTVAMADPANINALDDIRFFLNCDVKGAVSDEEAINRAFEKYYSGQTESVAKIISELEQESVRVPMTTSVTETIDLESIEEMTESAPVRKLLNLVILQAIRDRASDIHFEPFEDEFKIRYRIDGVLYEMVPPPRHLSLALTSRIKVMSNLDIAERRLPQDGRIELNVGGNPVDLRVSVVPTMFGESVVMRILDRAAVTLDLAKLGMREEELEEFNNSIRKPNGIILVTGPTGCGKTTTLYSALVAVNEVGHKIITTEDPVEYTIEGIIQVQVNPEIGVTFAECLRTILRQDPDKILIGEIRDLETAELAVQASLTGHIVFSTLHTNDAPATVTRLVDLGLPPYLVTATLETVVSQRLIRSICEHCREEYEPTREELMELGMTPEDIKGRHFYYGRGCAHCNNTGYRGRNGIFEIMHLDDELCELVMQQVSTNALREAARRKGMRTLRDAGLLAIYDGVTTISEVVRATLASEG